MQYLSPLTGALGCQEMKYYLTGGSTMRYGGKTAPEPLNWGFAGSTNQKVKIMTRKFKVGDIVNAQVKGSTRIKAIEMPIEKVGAMFIWVNEWPYNLDEVTLVTPIEYLSDKPGYHDQLTPWREESLLDDNPLIRSVADELVKMMLE